MRRVIVAFAVWVVAVSPVWAACGGSSPNWTSTADYASLSACVDGASAGDTITVTGNATWAAGQTVEFARGVTLVGSGNPTITGGQTLFYWIPSAAAQAAHDTFKVTGFTLDGNDANMGGAGIIRVYNTSASNYVTFALLDSTIRDISPSGRAMYLTGRIYGVAHGNIFDKVAIITGTYGLDGSSWDAQTQAYGVAENFYLEDNQIRFSADMSGYIGWIESGQGGRIVVRYNTWDFTNITNTDNVWDIHGLQSMQSTGGDANCAYGPPHDPCNPSLKVCGQHSTMVAEYYGNKIENAASADEWMRQRGGWMLMFNNSYGTASGTTWVGYAEMACDSCATTGSFTQHIANTYVWNNFQGASRLTMTKIMDSCADYTTGSPYTITANRDYYNFSASFNGTSGVGCGTLAARPATCTTGVGYWATNQSCSSLAGMVGANPSTPISGTLYKCTSTDTWASYYTPYAYPHPLAVTPAAPTGVRVK